MGMEKRTTNSNLFQSGRELSNSTFRYMEIITAIGFKNNIFCIRSGNCERFKKTPERNKRTNRILSNNCRKSGKNGMIEDSKHVTEIVKIVWTNITVITENQLREGVEAKHKKTRKRMKMIKNFTVLVTITVKGKMILGT